MNKIYTRYPSNIHGNVSRIGCCFVKRQLKTMSPQNTKLIHQNIGNINILIYIAKEQCILGKQFLLVSYHWTKYMNRFESVSGSNFLHSGGVGHGKKKKNTVCITNKSMPQKINCTPCSREDIETTTNPIPI